MEADLRSDAVIGVGGQIGGVVFREDSRDFSTVAPVVSDERRVVVVRRIVPRMTTSGQNRTRTDDYQSRQDEISCTVRHGCQSQIPGVGCCNDQRRESEWMRKMKDDCGWIPGFSTIR